MIIIALAVRSVLSRMCRLQRCYLSVLVALAFVPQVHGQAWLNNQWGFRCPVTVVNNSGSTLTNYQVDVSLGSTFNFAAALSNGADVRFTASDGVTPLNFWIASWNSPSSANIWVLVPSLPTSGTTIYLYYGNPAATSASNGSATFMFFDDFSYAQPVVTYINNAVTWITHAQDAIGNGGVSYYYESGDKVWYPQAYMEVTGYIISTVYDWSEMTTDPNLAANLRTRAGLMADFELASEFGDGSWGYVFDTGQVIEGMVRAYNETGKSTYLSAAERGANWLISKQAANGSWPTDFGGFAKPYQARVARALLQLWQADGNTAYRTAAINNLNWDVTQQTSNGWFQSDGINSTSENSQPITHTIAYTMEGLLDSGIILNNATYINAAKKTADALLPLQLPNGAMSGGSYFSNWTPASTSQVLTGDAQIALCWLKLYRYTVSQNAPNASYLNAAHRMNQYLVGVQGNSADPGIQGGLAGSDPLNGPYMGGLILSWATKFLIDDLSLESKLVPGGNLQFNYLDPSKWSFPAGRGGFFNGGGVLQYYGPNLGFGPRILAMTGGTNLSFTNGIIEYTIQGYDPIGSGDFNELALIYRGQNPETSNSYVFYPSTWNSQNRWLSYHVSGGSEIGLGSGGSFVPNTTYQVKAAINGSSFNFAVNGGQVISSSDTALLSGTVGFLSWGFESDSVSTFRIRNYAAIEPTTNVGQQQSFTSPVLSITPQSGTPQSARINTAFASALAATVKDSGGNPISGVTVTFTAPGSGASGTFAGGANTAVTNSSGVATSSVFTANSIAGAYTVTATAPGASAGASFSLTNLAGSAASSAATGGTPQSATVGTAFASPLAATVKDSGGNPISGVTVTFTAPGSGASGTFAGGANTAVTNSSGVATSGVFTANSTAGAYTVTATAPGASTGASFSLTNLAGSAASIAATSGSSQTAAIAPVAGQAVNNICSSCTNSTVVITAQTAGNANVVAASWCSDSGCNSANSLTMTVTDANHNVCSPVAGTLSNGTARTQIFVCPNISTAVSPDNSITCTASGTAYFLVCMANEWTGIASSSPADGTGGNTTATSGTPTVSTSAATTAGNELVYAFIASNAVPTVGSAYTPIQTLGGDNSAYQIGGSSPASYSATWTQSSAKYSASIATFQAAATVQSARVNTAFPNPLVATVKDSAGNPVSGVVVTFTAPTSGASGTFAGGVNTAVTNALGQATSQVFTANSTAGSYTVTASVAGVTTPASFTLTNLP